MGYKCTEVKMEEIDTQIQEYEYALIHMISEQIFCKITQLSEIDWEECLEARFFSEKGELHVFDADGEQKAVKVEDDGTELIFEKRYQLNGAYAHLGTQVVVQEYLNYDGDGQLIVELTRMKAVR